MTLGSVLKRLNDEVKVVVTKNTILDGEQQMGNRREKGSKGGSVLLADKQIVSCLLWSKNVFSREYEKELIIFPGKDQMFESSLTVCPNH